MVPLPKSKLFIGLSPDEMEPIIRISEPRHYLAAQAIFQEGELGDGVYVVGEGRVVISALVSEQNSQPLSHLGPGDFFGEMAVLDNGARSATAVAQTASDLWFIPRAGLLATLERSPKMAFSLVREFSLRLREFDRLYVQEMLQAERLSMVGRFARSIVHDFKNPLAIISLAADLGASENATLEKRRVAHLRIRKQVDRLTDMIDELLEFTKGTQTHNILSPTNYAVFMKSLLEESQPEAAQRLVELVCDNPPPEARLLLDPRRLTHAFHNLIHNAIEAMPEGGRVIFRFYQRDREVHTDIEDTGPGIDPQILGRLFQPFATFGKVHGTGLGLSICQRIVQDHKGKITARNEPGRGAIFTIALPLPEGR